MASNRRNADSSHRHTVPNSDYSSFPCFEEEVQFKTNVRKCTDSSDDAKDNENFQVNVSMHDKLKMCFAEMETMKDQFDNRRRKLNTKRRSVPPQQSSSQPPPPPPQPESKGKGRQTATSPGGEFSHIGPDTTSSFKQTFESSTKIDSRSEEEEVESKFKAHLIRTSSRDSIDDTPKGMDQSKSNDMLSHSPAYEETYVTEPRLVLPDHTTAGSSDSRPLYGVGCGRRSVSDPFGNFNFGGSMPRVDASQQREEKSIFGDRHPLCSDAPLPTNWSINSGKARLNELANGKSAETRRSYDEWLQKLDQVNDISRSTLKRIRHLESEMINLKMATDNLSYRQKSPKVFVSKIPVTSGAFSASCSNSAILRPNIAKKCDDKATNTDIDFKFMNDLLNHWRSRIGSVGANLVDVAFIDEPSRVPRRRLTTTLGRSVEIQTEWEPKSHQEKGISTDDWTPAAEESPINHKVNLIDDINTLKVPDDEQPKRDETPSEMSILDMPNIELEKACSSQTDFPTVTKTPEPIVEIYSDSEDTSGFDDFEKNIYNQISRRALIKNTIIGRRQTSRPTDIDAELNRIKLRHSSTQTNNVEIETPKEQESVIMASQGADVPNLIKKNLCSTSKIIIERVRMNQKEKSEIVLKTDIDNEGVVHRSTEVKNRKFKPKQAMRINHHQAPLMTNDGVQQVVSEPSTERKAKHFRKMNSDINMHHSRNIFSRPVSAIDIPNSELIEKKKDHFMSDKALSSIDIARKSPVISEGYHSEYLDNSSNRINAASSEYLLEPPKSFQNDAATTRTYAVPCNNEWEEISKSEVTNRTVNEELRNFKGMEMTQGNFLTLTNETVIDNTGKQTNITTKSRTIRKYKSKDLNKSSLDLHADADPEPIHMAREELTEMSRPQSVNNRGSLNALNSLQPIERDNSMYYRQMPRDIQYKSTHSLAPRNEQYRSPTMCNLSLVCNYDRNIVFSANIGLAKLPCFETNL